MKQSYFREGGQWFKGNIHSHTTVSDGVLSPSEIAEKYCEKGYDFLSMTDHNEYVVHNELDEEKIILITGVEHDIEYSPYRCVHLVGTGAYGKNETSYECRRYSKEELTNQQLADMMHNDEQFVTLAHPVWSRMTAEEVFALKNIDAIEVYNNGTEHLCHGGNAEVLWELLLRQGKRIFGVACDDVHTEDDLFGGWIWVKAEDRSQKSILSALREGQFYASNGPIINDFGIEDGKAYLICSECREIHFVTYDPRGESFFADGESLMTQASHRLTGKESFVRAVCVDKQGHSAWTQPIFF